MPAELVTKMVDAGESKLLMSTRDTLVRAYMAGAILALAAAFAVSVSVNTGNPLIGALLFPVGFCMLYLLGFDLLTGVFTLAPLAVMDKRPGATWSGVMRNWSLVFTGNFAGALTVAVFMAIIFTNGFHDAPNVSRRSAAPDRDAAASSARNDSQVPGVTGGSGHRTAARRVFRKISGRPSSLSKCSIVRFAAVSADGQVLAINRNCLDWLGIRRVDAVNRDFSMVFENSLATLIDKHRQNPQAISECQVNGHKLYLQLRGSLPNQQLSGRVYNEPPPRTTARPAASPHVRQPITLDTLNTGDNRLQMGPYSPAAGWMNISKKAMRCVIWSSR